MRRLAIVLMLVLAGAPSPVLAQYHGGRSHGGSHSYGTRSRRYTPRSYSHPRYHASPRPYRYRTHSARHYHSPRAHARPSHQRAPRPAPVPGARDRRGRLKRSAEAKRDFERRTGHPHGWPGHVVDHVVPLACGGADSPSNMQWQTIAEGKAKDRVERRGCQRH